MGDTRRRASGEVYVPKQTGSKGREHALCRPSRIEDAYEQDLIYGRGGRCTLRLLIRTARKIRIKEREG